MAKILIVEDDTDINNLLARIMRQQGYEAVQSFSGTEGKLRLELEQYDLMLLDLMLPGMKGEDLIREIRQTDPDLPIIVLSAKSALEDRLAVLELGADDYLVKPFAVEEVAVRTAGALRRSARQRELLRQEEQRENGSERAGSSGQESDRGEAGSPWQEAPRSEANNSYQEAPRNEANNSWQEAPRAGIANPWQDAPREGTGSRCREADRSASVSPRKEPVRGGAELRFRELTLNPDRREVRVKGKLLNLTVREYEILYLLMQEPGKVYSRESLYELVWQGGYYGEDNTVNVHVSNLRKKIAAADPAEYIATVWGIGFRMAQN